MKKILAGKLYNTETAKLIGYYETPGFKSDFQYYEESLFQKRNGEFFLSGSGGPATKYGSSINYSEMIGGNGIIPLSEREAKEWCEEYCDVEKYIELFGEPEE